MKPEDKLLLLQDLSARLPYRLKGKCEIDASYDTSFDTIFQLHKFDAVLEGIKGDLLFVTPLIEDKDEQEFANEEVADGIDILDFKLYLRPMSSMPEEEREFLNRMALENSLKCIEEEDPQKVFLLRVKHDAEELSYLYKHQYDVNGLIPKGLAIEVTEDNNPFKN